MNSRLSSRPCIVFRRTNHANAHSFAHSFNMGVLLLWTENSTVKTTASDANVVDETQHCGKYVRRTCFVSKARKRRSFNPRLNTKPLFFHKIRLRFPELKMLDCILAVGGLPVGLYAPPTPSPWFTLITSEIHGGRKKNTRKHWFQKWGSLQDEEVGKPVSSKTNESNKNFPIYQAANCVRMWKKSSHYCSGFFKNRKANSAVSLDHFLLKKKKKKFSYAASDLCRKQDKLLPSKFSSCFNWSKLKGESGAQLRSVPCLFIQSRWTSCKQDSKVTQSNTKKKIYVHTE